MIDHQGLDFTLVLEPASKLFDSIYNVFIQLPIWAQIILFLAIALMAIVWLIYPVYASLIIKD